VTVQAITPRKLTKEQRRLLEQLAAALPPQEFEPTPHTGEERGLFDKVKDIFG
jgi:molecular chaperone DnaJ